MRRTAWGVMILGGALALTAVAACKREAAPEPVAIAPIPIDANLRPDANPKPPTVRTSVRCAECHGKMADEWRGSRHAGSASSPLYLQLAHGDEACASCHAPLAALLGPDDLAGKEGVTCDVCHTISKVDLAAQPRFTLAAWDMVKYGPLCDAKDHYFHRMGCSTVHALAELCGACHQRVLATASGEVPLYTTYDEWKQSAYPAEGWVCQDCHMPGVRAPAAEGEPPREGVPDHGFFGGGDLRKDAAKLELSSHALDGGRVFEAAITNYAGHDMPSGFPGKRVVLRVIARDRAGKEVARHEQAFGRRLVDDHNQPTAYAGAVRVASDDRLKPKERRAITLFEGHALSGATALEADLVWQSIDPVLAAPLGVAVESRTIVHTRMKVTR
ncbi:MAG: hypothetical protein K8W52_14595 [Deltaproteobacteria bacterium]|nr:hypothetical protein [Deltaproteobacteria bacterium]